MGRPIGSKNKHYITKIKRICEFCDKEFYKYPSQLKEREGRTEGRFCSATCQRAGTIAQRTRYGEETGQWVDGRSSYRQRAIRQKGAKCEKCGYNRYKQLLWVHHKNFKPRKEQDDHSLENLEVLCIRCHLEKHCAVQKPKTT